MFFVHGWPDDETVWEEQVDYYSKKGWRCARVTMPHYACHPGIHEGMQWRRSGYNFDEIADMLHDAITRASGNGPPVVLVAHDWGSGYAFLLLKKYPSAAPALVTLDVAAVDWLNIGREPTLANYATLFAFGRTYQYGNILGFWLRRVPVFGNWLRSKSPFDALNSYSYWFVHRDHLLHALLRPIFRWLPDWQTSPLQGSFPGCPTLFVYGAAKPANTMFHAPEYPDELRQRGDGSDAIAFDCGHWVMTNKEMFKDMKVPDEMRATILKPGDATSLHKAMDAFLADLASKGKIHQPEV